MNATTTSTMFSSASVEWSTPDSTYGPLAKEFNFTLDVAATPENARCATYFTQAHDGLSRSWLRPYGETVWCNPPYGRGIGNWVAKARATSLYGTPVVMLLPARTDTQWWHTYIWNNRSHRPQDTVEVRFIPGRLKFGGHANSAPFPSVVVVFHVPPERA